MNKQHTKTLNTMDDKYSWVKTHKEIVQYLRDKEDSQQELIDLLKSVEVSPFNDKSKEGDYDIELSEIDPFSFFCYIHKYGEKRRLKVLQRIAEKLGFEVPEGESGIPSAQAQRVWLFPFKFLRVNNEIKRLWSFFKKELNGELNNDDFADVLNIKNVGKVKLTEALFYINPEKYLPINGPTKPYIKDELGLDYKFSTYSEYMELLDKIREKIDMPFYELSHEAWVWSNKKKKINYWVFQGNPDKFDFENAFKEDAITGWTVTAHKDKIKEGDKVIIWITGSEAGCYALADVLSKPLDKASFPESHYWKEDDKSELKAAIDITHNLANNPILKDEIDGMKELANLNVGHQGTNFAATEEEYKAILEMIEQNDKFEETKNKFDSEYGPSLFENFINNLRKIVSELNLQPNDERIVYSVRHNRFNFIIGQRYCYNIHLSYPRGVYGYISSEKLSEDSSPFDGPPKAYYNHSGDFNLTSEEWEALIETMKKELKKTKKSSYWKSNNKEFENYVFEIELEDISPKPNQMNFPLNTIFYGPPGTGKTYNTVLRAAEIVEDRKIDTYDEALGIFKEKLHDQIELITFHQNYSYEDFIQGLRPDIGNEKELTFEKKDGVFKVIADKALENHLNADDKKEEKKNYVIIIDEINRANISRVFGELITLIEPDKRSHGEIPLVTQLPSGDRFMVPSNLYIIGTMNTADKSIALLDIALRRRFVFEAMYPKYTEDGLTINDEAILKSLNESIIADKGHDFQIGHSFFMNSRKDAYDLEKRMNMRVIPLLLEYFMNDGKTVSQIVNKALYNTKYVLDDKVWPLIITERRE